MSLLRLEITGSSLMEQNVKAIAAQYELLTLTTKVVGENGKIPTWLFGRNALYNNVGPPRVTWIPTSGAIGAPSASTEVVGTERLRAILTREVEFEVHCNGTSYEQTENLIGAVAAACRRVLGPESGPTDELWVTDQEGTHDNALNKVEAILTVNMRIPVVDEQKGLVTITAQGHTEILDPDLAC